MASAGQRPGTQGRRAVARRPDAPPEVLERLVRAHGDVFHIRPLLVDHPNFPRHTLRTFVDEPSPDADPEVADDAAANSTLRLSSLYRILTAAGL
ncbi:hypothetical protein ACWGDX_11305 [Streptomyces sp. NPDC055025]